MKSGLIMGLVGMAALVAGCSSADVGREGQTQEAASTRARDAQIAGATFVRSGRVTGASSVIIPACPTCEGGTLGTLVDLELASNGCMDQLGDVGSKATPRSDGGIDLSIAAVNLLDKRSLVAFCSGESMVHRTSVMVPGSFEATAIHLQVLTADAAAGRVRDPAAQIGGGSLVRSAAVKSAREIILASCPTCLGGPPGTLVELELPVGGCYDALGPVTHRAVAKGDGTVDVEFAAINLEDRRSMVAFCSQEGLSRRATVTLEGSYAADQIRLHVLAAPR